MTVEQIYKLNMVPYAQRTNRTMFPPTVTLSQYDKAFRTITFDLYENGDPYLVPENAVVHVFGMKPDGNAFEYEMTIAEDRRRVSINVQVQMGTVAGDIPGEVVIFESAESDNRIGSANFMFQVEPTVVGDDAQFSESDMPIIQTILFGGTPGDVLMKKANGVEWASDSPSGYMRKSVYDQNNNGIVDNAEAVNGHTVARDVDANEYTNSQIDSAIGAVAGQVSTLAGQVSTLDAAAVKSVNGKTPTAGAVTIGKTDVGLGNVDNTSDADKPISTATQAALNQKVNAEAGKGLSSNDYTTAEKEKLAGLPTGQEIADDFSDVNVALNQKADASDLSALEDEVDGKQDTLTFDSAPTEDSQNPVTSDGIFESQKAQDEQITLLTELVEQEHSGDWATIQKMVQMGLGPKFYPVGTQFTIPHATYGNMLFDVIGHDHDLPAGKEHSMTLLMHHVIYGTQVGAEQALYYAEEAMPAGTYVFRISSTWSQALAGYYKFTTSQEIPAGGQVGPIVSIADTAPSAWKVSTYASRDTTMALESNIVISSATGEQEGTFLGNITSPTGNLNYIQRIGYGSNDWEESGVRQWLNADVETDWFEPKTIFDRPISYASRPGFLFGFGADFKACLAETTHGNRSNTVFDSHGTNKAYSTTEKVFLLCNEECGLAQEQGIVCGTLYDYYKNATNTDRIKYDITSQGTARLWWLRSPYPSYAHGERIVLTSGVLNVNYARNGRGVAAACVIA